ncbi:MAG TPA: hypothetical protein VHE54_11045 [Puia sp.]|nr:hypothetical protein [Puia sp.]
MATLGKRILSVFVENGDAATQRTDRETAHAGGDVAASRATSAPPGDNSNCTSPVDERFAVHFDKLFTDANIAGPDYYEFARMITAMQVMPDERARYAAAFAGLQAQGLDKERLLATAADYLRLLGQDADSFQKTVEASLQEKVHSRAAEAEEKNRRIQQLSKEILELQTQIGTMQQEIRDSQGKLEAGRNAYAVESERRRRQIETDVEKINHYIP